jgi:hypothetical protein
MVDMNKEKQPMSGGERIRVPDQKTAVEAPKSEEQNLETLSWMEKIEKKFARVPNQTADVNDDTVVVQQPQAQQPPVTLPVNQQQIQAGKKAKPELSIAWLVTWVIRQIKVLAKSGRRVRLQDMPEVK